MPPARPVPASVDADHSAVLTARIAELEALVAAQTCHIIAELEQREQLQALPDSATHDATNLPIDYRFLQINPAFERLTSLVNATGHTMRELVPGVEMFWPERYGQVALTGEALRFEPEVAPLGRWFDVHASRVGDPASQRVAIVFNNITIRKAAEQQARLAFAASLHNRGVRMEPTLPAGYAHELDEIVDRLRYITAIWDVLESGTWSVTVAASLIALLDMVDPDIERLDCQALCQTLADMRQALQRCVADNRIPNTALAGVLHTQLARVLNRRYALQLCIIPAGELSASAPWCKECKNYASACMR